MKAPAGDRRARLRKILYAPEGPQRTADQGAGVFGIAAHDEACLEDAHSNARVERV